MTKDELQTNIKKYQETTIWIEEKCILILNELSRLSFNKIFYGDYSSSVYTHRAYDRGNWISWDYTFDEFEIDDEIISIKIKQDEGDGDYGHSSVSCSIEDLISLPIEEIANKMYNEMKLESERFLVKQNIKIEADKTRQRKTDEAKYEELKKKLGK